MALTKSFIRVEDPLRLPDTIGLGYTSAAHGGVWGWSQIPSNAAGALPLADQIAAADAGQADLRAAIPRDGEFHIKVQYGTVSADDYYAERYTPGMTAGQLRHLDWCTARIREQEFSIRQTLLGVRLDQIGVSGTAAHIETIRRKFRLGSAAKEAAKVAHERETALRLNQFHSAMRASSLKGQPAPHEALAWSIWRDLTRTPRRIPATSFAAGGYTMRYRDANPTLDRGMVRVDTDRGPQWIRLIIPAVNGWADTLELPGGEWMERINLDVHSVDGFPEPVEVSIRGKMMGKSTAKGLLEQARRLLMEQHESSEGRADLSESLDVITERLEQLERREIGYADHTVTWVVPGSTPEEAQKRGDAVIHHLRDVGIEAFAPHAITDLLYKQLIPGDTRRVQEFDAMQVVHTIAGSSIFTGSDVGDKTGPYVAENLGASGGPVMSRLSDAQMTDKATTTVHAGASGTGKSTGVVRSFVPDLVDGALVVLPDYKGDLTGVRKLCELFDVPVTYIDMSHAPRGSMDSFTYLPPGEAAAAVTDDLSAVLGATGTGEWASDRQAAIRAAAHDVANQPNPTTYAVLTALLASEDKIAREVGRNLTVLFKNDLAAALVAEDATDGGTLAGSFTPGLVYFGFGDVLTWPAAEDPPERWNPSERVSMLLVQAVLRYMTHAVRKVRGVPKIIAIPELHYLTAYSFGRSFLSKHILTGRAKDENLVLDTQVVVTLLQVPGLEDNATEVHCYGVTSAAEAQAQAKLLGRECDDAFIAEQKARGNGEHLMRDRDGRLAVVRYDLLCTEVAEAISTRPTRAVDQREDAA